MKLDLGCWNAKPEGFIGIDRVGPPATQADIVCNLGFEKIPIDANSVDHVRAIDVLEHIPFFVYDTDGSRVAPMIFLFNNLYEVMKNGAELIARVPNMGMLGRPQMLQPVAFAGIEHCSYWTYDNVKTFAGNYYGTKDLYGHTSNFSIEKLSDNGEYIHFTLKAHK